MSEPNAVQLGYDRWSSVYDHDGNPLIALEEPVVRRMVGDPAGKRALDLGCGTGRHARWLASRGALVTAIDFSEGMLRQARVNCDGLGVDFRIHDISRPLPFGEASFDLVVSGLVLEHLADMCHFFREIKRVARRDARAVISAMHPAMFLRGGQARFTDPDTGAKIAPGSHPHAFADVIMSVIRAGLQIEELEEHAPDEEFAARRPRAEKYVGWPMLISLALRA